jgi:hypothetical protein
MPDGELFELPLLPLDWLACWDKTFREVSRRRVGGGPKVIAAEEITWVGDLGGRTIHAVSRVRLLNPMESFETSSGHRLRDSKVGDAGHWVDLRVSSEVSDAELRHIAALAQAEEDRVVKVTRGRHAAIKAYIRHGT